MTLVVGYCPVAGSPGDLSGIAFVGTDSGRRLARYCGLPTSGHLLDHFELVNLFREPDASWDRARGRRRAAAIVSTLVVGRHDRVLALSAPVAEAFGATYHPLLQWHDRFDSHPGHLEWHWRLASVPHPSGLVRWWNDSGNVERASAFLREQLATAGAARGL